ncbi:MAG: hypothetical protein ACXWP4_12355 [Polyangiales bacterium]
MRAFARLSFVTLGVLAFSYVGCGASSDKSDNEVFNPTGGDTGSTDDDGGGLGGEVGPTDDSGLASLDLTVTPINAVVYIDTGKTPVAGGTQVFTVTESGTDVSATTTFTLEDTSLGSFSANTFTSVTDLGKDATGADILGKTTIANATAASGKKAQAKITVVKLRKTEDPVTSAKDFFFTMPYKANPDPKEDILKFTTNIQQVDVAFVMDTTGSMSGEISNLRTSLSGTIIPALKAAIPSVGIAVVDHRDVPFVAAGGYFGYGDLGDWAAKVWAPITVQTDAAALKTGQDAVGKYAAGGGSDGPEAQVVAMYFTLTGKGFSWPASSDSFGDSYPAGSLATVTPKAGTKGAVNFRDGAVPVVVSITDINAHNGAIASDNYSGFTAPNITQLEDEFKKANAKFVGIYLNGSNAYSDGNPLSDATSSNIPPSAFDGAGKPTGCGAGQCCTGLNGAGKAPDATGGRCRLNFACDSSGNGVSTGVVNAIKAIASGSVYDILPEVTNDPKNPDMVDATIFIDRLEAFADMSMGCAGVPRKSTPSKAYNDMVGGILAGKQTACFKVIPKENDTVSPKESAQFFKAFINMKGIAPGVEVKADTPQVDLGDTRTVLFLVPPTAPIPK